VGLIALHSVLSVECQVCGRKQRIVFFYGGILDESRRAIRGVYTQHTGGALVKSINGGLSFSCSKI
jgi:hypothetical protein